MSTLARILTPILPSLGASDALPLKNTSIHTQIQALSKLLRDRAGVQWRLKFTWSLLLIGFTGSNGSELIALNNLFFRFLLDIF